MADSASVNRILDEYGELKKEAAKKRRESMDFVYSHAPRIKEIDEKMNFLGMENVKKIIKEPLKSDEINKKYKEEIKKLEEEKSAILKKKGLPEDYKEYKYKCKICSDTGRTPQGKRCACFEQKLIAANYSASNLGDKLKEENFDNFSFDYYSKEKGNYPNSPYENMQRIYQRAKNFCDNFDNEYRNMLFYGAPGLGKTFLSSCIAKELIDKCKSVIYIRASKLFMISEDNRFGRNRDQINSLYESDLLIIDDLGTETVMKNNNSYLFDVVDERLMKKKSMIINTNLDISELTKIYTSRFTSRIMESFVICKLYGEDIRFKK
ncbi:MAG: ATP-binding protein [Clostridiales bacterium]|nr:ATP-binding protein [Clostridiales bacterium]